MSRVSFQLVVLWTGCQGGQSKTNADAGWPVLSILIRGVCSSGFDPEDQNHSSEVGYGRNSRLLLGHLNLALEGWMDASTFWESPPDGALV